MKKVWRKPYMRMALVVVVILILLCIIYDEQPGGLRVLFKLLKAF
ncbi:hypothetical protein SAMN04488112_12223 [Melghirimyces thermohalophilus]|uniref:Uncharacterized protein n=1 Tax=Melghirimyces thermohalophilus TaxID=1236220 RepID=A0A1G6QJJ1_9BACL|nr:hypothetical protein SAMN04488112_12223 [Melghirimyces thermohalophilus]